MLILAPFLCNVNKNLCENVQDKSSHKRLPLSSTGLSFLEESIKHAATYVGSIERSRPLVGAGLDPFIICLIIDQFGLL